MTPTPMPDDSTTPGDPAQHDPTQQAAGQAGGAGALPPQMFAVDPAEIDSVLALPVPTHPETTFDEAQFKDLVARSFSITLDEKREIVTGCGKFSQHQVDELFRILTEERVKFAELNAKHAARMTELEQKHAAEWAALEAQANVKSAEQTQADKDAQEAEEIKKSLGL